MTETTGSEHTPDHAQAKTSPDNPSKPTAAETHSSSPSGGLSGDAELVVAPAAPTVVDPAELPAVSREVPATRLLDQPTPAPDLDEEDVSGSADPAALVRARAHATADADADEAPSDGEAPVEQAETPQEPEPEVEEPSEPVPSSWDELELPPSLRSAIDALGWTKPTPVQARAFATMVAGTDVLVQSQTGSGKTGAFCLPWLASRFERGPAKDTGVQLIVLLPTRELAKQVCDELVRLAADTPVSVLPVYGGTAMAPQLDALAKGVHAVVGTPGRILDHIRRRSLDLSRVRTVVLDECDEMLSMGFLEDIRAILSACPSERQTCLFSATVPREIERIARRHMRDPARITLSGDEIAAAEIDHAYYSTGSGIKTRDLLDVIMLEDPPSAIVFCNTREETRLVANVLQKNGYSAEALSSDLTQAAREKVMARFRDRQLRFLVATDVAARGIDVSHVSHVINYSFPEAAEVYVHRTGRTGRAGRAGTALSIISPLEIGSFYTLTKSYKSIQFTERKLPPKDELAATRTEVKLDRISHDYSEPVSPEWLLLARRLIEDPRGERVVAYLLHEAIESERFAKRQAQPESEDEGEGSDSFELRAREREDRRGRERRGRERGRRGRDGDRERRSRDRDEPRRRRRERREDDRVRESASLEQEPTAALAGEELEQEQVATSEGVELAGEVEVESADLDATGDSDERPRKRRRRRRRRKPHPDEQNELASEALEADLASPSAAADEDEDTDEDDDESSAAADLDEGEDDKPKKRRRRKRRRGRSNGATVAAASEEPQVEAEPDKKKRRRRRRRKSVDDGNGETDTHAELAPIEETPRVSQDEIIIDIDEQELDAVRDEFGEIDELDELTLKGRRRAVLEDLTEEMEVEDLTASDARDTEEEEDEEDESDEDDEFEGESEVDTSEATPPSPASEDSQDEGQADSEAAPAEQAPEATGRKKKRRRRRRKKTPIPTPELTCPPHKDFWEVWAAKYSAKDFEREDDNLDTDNALEDELAAAELEPEPEPESTIPLIEDAPDEDSLVRVGLNIGRRQGHKAAHIRALLKRLTGLHGKAVKDLTVRDTTSLFRMDVRHFETVLARLDGSVIEDVSLTLVHLDADNEQGENAELALRVPEPRGANGDATPTASEDAAAVEDAEPQPVEDAEPQVEDAEPQPAEELAAAPEDA